MARVVAAALIPLASLPAQSQTGKFTNIDVPGALSTFPSDINDRGEITGSFT
jgi:hypothetical protein